MRTALAELAAICLGLIEILDSSAYSNRSETNRDASSPLKQVGCAWRSVRTCGQRLRIAPSRDLLVCSRD